MQEGFHIAYQNDRFSGMAPNYSRKNAYAASPGVWFTDDGEFELYRDNGVWNVKYRAYWTKCGGHQSRLIGSTATLNEAFVLAGRYYMHPVVPTDTWNYPTTKVSA